MWIFDNGQESWVSKEVGHDFSEIDPLNWPWENYIDAIAVDFKKISLSIDS